MAESGDVIDHDRPHRMLEQEQGCYVCFTHDHGHAKVHCGSSETWDGGLAGVATSLPMEKSRRSLPMLGG